MTAFIVRGQTKPKIPIFVAPEIRVEIPYAVKAISANNGRTSTELRANEEVQEEIRGMDRRLLDSLIWSRITLITVQLNAVSRPCSRSPI